MIIFFSIFSRVGSRCLSQWRTNIMDNEIYCWPRMRELCQKTKHELPSKKKNSTKKIKIWLSHLFEKNLYLYWLISCLKTKKDVFLLITIICITHFYWISFWTLFSSLIFLVQCRLHFPSFPLLQFFVSFQSTKEHHLEGHSTDSHN